MESSTGRIKRAHRPSALIMDTGQKTESIKDLCDRISHREIVLPEFQRDFVWDITQTFELFDSLIRDIFIGSLIYGIPSFAITVREIDTRPRKGQVDNGQYGDVKLDGVRYALAGEFALKIVGEPIKRSFVAYYIDSGASAEQKEALRKLFNGPSFAGMGKAIEVTEAAIKFENLDGFGQVGKTASGTVGEIAKVEVTPIAGGTNPGKPLVVENEAEPGLKWTALGKTSNSFYRSPERIINSKALAARAIDLP